MTIGKGTNDSKMGRQQKKKKKVKKGGKK